MYEINNEQDIASEFNLPEVPEELKYSSFEKMASDFIDDIPHIITIINNHYSINEQQ